MDQKELKLTKITSVLLLAVVLSIYGVFYLKPVIYVHLIAEDSWGEYCTFVFYLAALLLMVFAMVNDRRYVKPGFLLLALCFFFMAMEEISWGQRLMGLHTPEALGALNRQGETNIHNLVRVNRLLRLLCVVILVWAIVLPFLMNRYATVNNLVDKFGVPVSAKYLWPFFICAAFFIIGRPLPRAVEIGELLLGFSFLAYALDTFYAAKKGRATTKLPLYVPISCGSIAIIFVTGFLVTNWPNQNALRIRYCSFVSSELPDRGLHKQSESILRHIIDKPDLMTVEFLSRLESLLKDQSIGVSDIEITDSIVEKFNTVNDIKFSVDQKRKEFNMRRTDFDDRRARFLLGIGTEYQRLDNFKRAESFFNSSLEYASGKSHIDEINLYRSKTYKNNSVVNR